MPLTEPRILDRMPTPLNRLGPRPTYPWGDWLDGQVWELVPGVHFQVTTISFRGAARAWARRRRMRVSVMETSVGTVCVQAFR